MDKDKKKSYLAGWSAAIRKNGSLLKNGRLKRVMSVLNLDEASANELLQMYWDEVLRGEESLSTAGNDEFYFSTLLLALERKIFRSMCVMFAGRQP